MSARETLAPMLPFPVDATRERLWEEFHAANPAVWELFERYAIEAAAKAGRAHRIGARMVWERIRWHVWIETRDPAGQAWRLNDHYVPYYARHFLAAHPELGQVFELRAIGGGR